MPRPRHRSADKEVAPPRRVVRRTAVHHTAVVGVGCRTVAGLVFDRRQMVAESMIDPRRTRAGRVVDYRSVEPVVDPHCKVADPHCSLAVERVANQWEGHIVARVIILKGSHRQDLILRFSPAWQQVENRQDEPIGYLEDYPGWSEECQTSFRESAAAPLTLVFT